MPDHIFFDAVIRDFTKDHPDFQSMDGHATGLVKSTLGPDSKPVFNGGAQLTTKENFDQWYNDVPGVNKRTSLKIVMNKTEKGTYVYDNVNFFPADGQGWGDTEIALDGRPHNFFFTLELHTNFVYGGGEEFTFRGDDDVWVFINGELVIDLGGVHHPMNKSVALDSLGYEPGTAMELSFFFAERRCCGSEFRIETTIRPVTGTCTVWGDPHIDVFDSGLFGREKADPVSIYRSGDYWLVKNEKVWIQGRYGPTVYTVDGQSALLALAVGGPFLLNHTLIIEALDGGKVTWDGEEILTSFPSEFVLTNFIRVAYAEGEKHIDENQENFPIKMVRAFMPRMVNLKINRWAKHIDAIIQMPQQLGGQDGHCGNFNLNDTDDTKEQILQRIQAVAAEELLFGAAAFQAAPKVEHQTLADCGAEVRAKADTECRKAAAEKGIERSEKELELCVFDKCFGGEDFPMDDAVTLKAEKEAVEAARSGVSDAGVSP